MRRRWADASRMPGPAQDSPHHCYSVCIHQAKLGCIASGKVWACQPGFRLPFCSYLRCETLPQSHNSCTCKMGEMAAPITQQHGFRGGSEGERRAQARRWPHLHPVASDGTGFNLWLCHVLAMHREPTP